VPYEKVAIPIAFQRSIIDYQRKEQAGTIVVDTDARYLYTCCPRARRSRYGVTVGEDAQSWAGVAKKSATCRNGRLGCRPRAKSSGWDRSRTSWRAAPANPMGARAMYLFQGSKDTLFRIHGTNQPEYIGEAISFRLHPHDQRGRDRPLQAGQGRDPGGGAEFALRMASG